MQIANCSSASMENLQQKGGPPLGLTTGDLGTQKDWHNSYKDLANNMYRTSYQDMIHGREIAVKSDMPSGYGGHIPSLRHDVLFKNTEFDRMRGSLKSDHGRDTMPSFQEQNLGLPAMTPNPRGRPRPPTAGTIPTYSHYVKPPWALTTHLQEPLTFRTSMSRGGQSSKAPNSAREMTRPSTTMAVFGSKALKPQTPRSGMLNTSRPSTSQGGSRGGPRFYEPNEEMELLKLHIAG